MKKMLMVAIPTLLFAGAGFAYYHYVGCDSGTCAIASSPISSTDFGAIIGASVGFTLSDGRKKDADL
jgi:phage shock protein E